MESRKLLYGVRKQAEVPMDSEYTLPQVESKGNNNDSYISSVGEESSGVDSPRPNRSET